MLGQLFPAVPVAFAQAVFDGDDGVFFHQFIEPGDHLVGGLVALAGFLQFIHAGFRIVEFAGGHVHSDADFFARLVACRLNGFHDALERRFVVFQVGGKAALVTHSGNLAFFLQNALQGVEGFRAHADGFLHALGADRHDHEFLEIHRGIRVAAAVQYVHHRHRQGLGIDAAQIAVQRQAVYVRSRMSHSQRNAQDGVGAVLGLVLGAVRFDQGLVNGGLAGNVHTLNDVRQHVVHVVHGLLHALAEVTGFIAVAQLQRFAFAGGGAAGHHGAAKVTAGSGNLYFDGGVAPGV